MNNPHHSQSPSFLFPRHFTLISLSISRHLFLLPPHHPLFHPPHSRITKIPPISSTKRSLKRRQNLLRTEESPQSHMEVEEVPNQNVGRGREDSPMQQDHTEELSPESTHTVPSYHSNITNRTQRRFFRKSRRTCSTTPRFRQSISFSRQI